MLQVFFIIFILLLVQTLSLLISILILNFISSKIDEQTEKKINLVQRKSKNSHVFFT